MVHPAVQKGSEYHAPQADGVAWQDPKPRQVKMKHLVEAQYDPHDKHHHGRGQ